MAKRYWAIVALLLLVSVPAGASREEHDRYYEFLTFAECYVVHVYAVGGCQREEAIESRDAIYAHRMLFLTQTRDGRYTERHKQLLTNLIKWTRGRYDAGLLTQEQYKYFLTMLSTWQ